MGRPDHWIKRYPLRIFRPSQQAPGAPPAPIDLHDPSLYLNRELSWIEFNRRVFEEAQDERHPLLERVKFLAIFGSNLDEFFMIRVSGLKDQVAAGVVNTPPDGMTPLQQLEEIRARVLPLMVEQGRYWREESCRPCVRPTSTSWTTPTLTPKTATCCVRISRTRFSRF